MNAYSTSPRLNASSTIALSLTLAMFAAACGAGTAGLVAGAGDGNGGNDAPVLSSFAVADPKVPPAQLKFRLADHESNPARVTLHYQLEGAPARELSQIVSGIPSNPAMLDALPEGRDYFVEWNFAAEPDLPDDASYVSNVRVFATVEGGIQEVVPGTNAAAVGLGNDPPVVDSLVVPPSGEDARGIVLVDLTVTDSSSDVVSVRVEYDIIGDVPDAGWQLARAAQDDVTHAFAIRDVVASTTGTELAFFWDTNFDLFEIERDVRLRSTATDAVVEGTAVTSAAFRIDNNAEPIASIQEGVLIVNPDQRRGIPIPITLIDEEGDDVEVVVQWRRERESFPELPGTAAEIRAILADPELRSAHQVCSEYPRPVEGIALPVDATRVRLPELADRAAHLQAFEVAGRELEIVRPPNRFGPLAQGWSQRSLARPVAALPLRDGLTALVLDSQSTHTWRLRELDLATGDVVRTLASGAGDPSAAALDRHENFSFVASDTAGVWTVSRVDLRGSSAVEVVEWNSSTQAGVVRGMASSGENSVLFTLGSSLVRADFDGYPNTHRSTLLDDLATPWGIAIDPTDSQQVFIAERDVVGPQGLGRILRVDLNGLGVQSIDTLAPDGSDSPFPRPIALAFERRGSRLLVLCETDPGITAELRAVDLGGEVPDRAFTLAKLPGGVSTLVTGAQGLRLVTRPEFDEVLAGGGVEQRRGITHHDVATETVTVDRPFAPHLSSPKAWRIEDKLAGKTSANGRQNLFVWDTADVHGGEFFLQATPLDAEVGVSAATSAPRRIMAPLEVREPLVLAASGPSPFGGGAITSDIDGDGDQDILSANPSDNNVTVFFQTSPGIFDPNPLVLGGLGTTTYPLEVAAGDLDGDGDQDIVSANSNSDDLTVFFQTSPGVFADPPLVLGGPPVTHYPASVAISDLDGDGDRDIVSANANSSNLTIFFQTSAGVFAEPSVVGDPLDFHFYYCVAAADMDGDGDQDLVGSVPGEHVVVHFQTSPGIFAANKSLLSSSGSSAVPVDIDGDGDQDILTLSDTSRVLVYLQTGFAEFASDPITIGESASQRPIACDVDGDGDQDILWANNAFLQTSPGNFVENAGVIGGEHSAIAIAVLAASDLDGDGDADIVAGHNAVGGGGLTVLFQSSAGEFVATPQVIGSAQTPYGGGSVSAPDLDADGDLDLLWSYDDEQANFKLAIYFQKRTGVFNSTPLVISAPSFAPPMAVDLDCDGDQDILWGLSVFFQTSPGEFAATPMLIANGGVPGHVWSVASADLDGDGDMDVAFTHDTLDNLPYSLNVCFQTSPGVFGPPQLVIEHGTSSVLACSDVDGDGDQDIVSSRDDPHEFNSELMVFFQTSPGVFSGTPLVIQAVGHPYQVVLADVDRDGDQDIVAPNINSNEDFAVYFQSSPGAFAEPPLPLDAGFTYFAPITVNDLDGDGDLDLLFAQANVFGARPFAFIQSSPQEFTLTPLALWPDDQSAFPVSMTAADVDGDGEADIISAVGGLGTGNQALRLHWGGH